MEFYKGQVVCAKERYHMNPTKFYDSYHILTEKDIRQGYYYTYGGSFSLEDSAVADHPLDYYRNRCSTLKGKSLQPISSYKFMKITSSFDAVSCSCYVWFRGVRIYTKGHYYKGQLYFLGHNGFCYKAKTFVNKNGYLVGWGADLSSPQQEARSAHVKELYENT